MSVSFFFALSGEATSLFSVMQEQEILVGEDR